MMLFGCQFCCYFRGVRLAVYPPLIGGMPLVAIPMYLWLNSRYVAYNP